MIFRTITTDVEGLTNKFGILGKSFADIRRDFGNGQGIFTSVFSGKNLTSNDINSIKQFNDLLKNNIPIGQAWKRTMSGCTSEAKRQVVQFRQDGRELSELITEQEAAKESTVGLTIASTALNVALSLGISFAIQGLIKLYDELAHAAEHCKERVDDLMSSYNSAISEANSHADKVEEIADRYEELSKGVDGLGKNVSLTTEEYAEYNDIVNQVADMFPTLISGYTSEGNAILSLKGNVEELRDAYKEAQQEAYNLLIASGKDGDGNDIMKNWQNTIAEFASTTAMLRGLFDWGKADVGGRISASEASADLETILSSSYEDVHKMLSESRKNDGTDKLSPEGQSYLAKLGLTWETTEKEFEDMRSSLRATKQSLDADIESALSNVKQLANAFLMTNEDYKNLDEQSQAAASKIVNSIDEGLASSFGNNKDKVGAYVISIVNTLKGNPEIRDSLTGLFTLDTSELSPNEAKEIVDTYIKAIAQALGEDENELKIRLGFEDTDDLAAKYMNAINSVSEKFADNPFNRSGVFSDIQQFFKDNSINTQEEIDRWIEVAKSCKTAEEAKKKYLEASPDKAKFNTETLTKQIDELQNAYKTIQGAVQEYNKEGYVSVDTYQSLLGLGSDYLKYLFDEEGNLRLDEQAIKDVTIARIKELTVQQKQALLDMAETWNSEADAQKTLKTAIDDTTSAYEDSFAAQIKNLKAKWAEDENWTPQGIEDAVIYLSKEFAGLDKLEKATIDGINDGFGMIGENAEDANKKLKDTQKQIADLNDQQALADLKYSIETVNQELEQTAKILERIDALTDLTFESDFTTKLQNAGQQFLTASRYGGQMREEMERLLAIEPQSASEAEELASSLESLSDKFFDNEQKILEYRNTMYETVLDFNSALAENEVTKNENAKKILDDTYDILEHGSLSGGFWSRALLPSISKDKVSQQRAENNKLLKEEERYQNAIAEIRKKATDMSKAEEDAERAKQRQEYLQELSEAQSGYESSITRTANIANEATSSMKDGVDDLTNSIKNASDEWDSFNSKYAQSYQGQTSDVSGKFTGNELTDAALSKISQGSFVDTHATYKGNPVKALYDEASKAYKFYVYENVSGNATYREFTPEEYIRDVNDTLLNAEGGVTSGVTIVNEGTGSLSGREGYIGKDGKLHWFKDEKNLMFNTDDVVRVISAPDMANIIKYTGTKFFNEPISDLSSVTVDNYASGNTNVSFRTPSSSKQSVTVDVDDVTQAFIDGINQSLSEIKDNVTLEALKESFYENLTDEEFISTFAYGISTATKTAVDEADENMSNAIKALILQNSAWDDLPDELREKFAKLGAVAENWSEWIGNGDNTLQAFNLMENSDVSSWDILDQNVTTLLQEYGIHGKEAWDTFIEENPLQALQLLLSSWDALSTLIQQYMDDMTTTVTNGAAAIKAVKIDAPSISQESWDALQTLIANKIQEILNVINETFGANTVDLNFGISTSLQTTSTGNGAAMGSIPYYNQGDYADYTYGSGSMAQTACGPTSMAMVLSGLSGKSVSPVETARWAESHGHYIQGAGTSWAFFNAIASEYGIKSQSISYSADNLRTALSGGNIVITSMAPGHFTKNGHFIVLTGLTSDGQVMVNDPGSRERTHAWDLNTVANEAKQAWAFSAYATGTGGAKAGMAILGDEGLQKGDTKNAYPELVFSKSTGKAFLAGLNGAEMVRLGAGDTVVPYSDTKKFLSNGSSFNAYAKGTKSAKKAVRNQSEKQNNQNTQMSSQTKALQSWDVPQGLGKSHSYTAFDEDGYLGPSLGHWSKGSAAWQLFQQLLATGNLTTDQNGIYTYKGARLIAMTSTFGKAGDVMRFTQDDGSVYYGIIMDEKSQSYTWYDNNPANAWGHQNGQDIVEFEVKRSAIAPAYKANGGTPPYGNLSHYISTIENLGSLEGFDFSNISDVATNPLLIKYQEALQKIQELMGVFQTNTHTAASKVANYKSLGDKRGKYGFDATFTAHANGTGDYHIVGENNKPEIMRDKRTGKLSVVDSPMLFDPNEYDVIGEKTTAEYLKSAKLYANGTTDAKQTQTEEEKEEKKKQEEAEKQAEKDREAMQKSLDTINEHLSEGNKLTLEGNTYSKEELEKMANLMSDFGEEEIVDPDKLNTILDYASYFKELDEWIEDKLPDLLESYNEQYERDYNAERAKYLEWQKDYTSRVNKFNENPTSGNYMDEWLKLLDEGHAQTMATLNTQTKLNADSIKQSLASLKDPLKKAEEMWLNAPTATLQRKALETLNNIRETEDDLNSQYVDIISKLGDQRVQEIEQRNLGFQSRLSFLDSDNSSIDRALDKVQSAAEQSKLIGDKIQNSISQVSILEEQRNAAHQDVIDNIYNSADEDIQRILQTVKVDEAFDANGEFNDIYYKQIEALGNLENGAELVAKYEELVMKPLQEDKKTWVEATGAIEELTDSIDDLELQRAQTKIEVYTENLERLNEIDEVRKSKQDAITSAMEKQHSLAQSLREEISSINAELDANKHTEQWLDEDTRKLIFNDEDYEAELKAINDIQAEATREYNRYKSKIAGLNETEWYQEQKITDEYNKRMDVLNEQLQVEKDKLAVKKKELEYNNALKERDTRIIIGGRSVQVANPDTMYNLAKERSQAQSDLNNTLLKNSETEQERQSDRIAQSINQEIETRNKMVELIGKMSDAEQELFAATLPVIQELEVFKEALSPQNIPWLNSHSRDYRGDFVDMPELYKHGGYNQAHDYAGDYPVIEQLHKSGIIRDDVYEALTQQAENQHNWKRSTDINTAQYPYTSNYDGVNYGTEYYGINDQDKWSREQAKEYIQLAYEINHGVGTQAQLDRIQELNDSNAKDNKYIANTLDTTMYAVNEDGIVIRKDQTIRIDDDSIQQVGDIARGFVQTVAKAQPKEGSIAHGNYPAALMQDVGEIPHHAKGTKSAKDEIAITDELGAEAKLHKIKGKYTPLSEGDWIFTAQQTENLAAWGNISPAQIMADRVSKMVQDSVRGVQTLTNNNNVSNTYNFNGDNVFTETIDNADDFVASLASRASARSDQTRNMRG